MMNVQDMVTMAGNMYQCSLRYKVKSLILKFLSLVKPPCKNQCKALLLFYYSLLWMIGIGHFFPFRNSLCMPSR